jgi:predicted deacylase
MHAGLRANDLPGTLAIDRLIPMLDAADRKGQRDGRVTSVPNA